MFNSILNTKNKINVIVASKHESFEYLTMAEAKELLDKGIITLKPYTNSIKDPDIILVSSGSVPTLEVICAYKILKAYIKDIKIKVIVVGDLLKLRNKDEYTDKEFDNMFTLNHCIFAFHGYPSLIHDLLYDRNNKFECFVRWNTYFKRYKFVDKGRKFDYRNFRTKWCRLDNINKCIDWFYK